MALVGLYVAYLFRQAPINLGICYSALSVTEVVCVSCKHAAVPALQPGLSLR
jgi:hypothetical protein